MPTIYGESPEIRTNSYEGNGGIATFTTNDNVAGYTSSDYADEEHPAGIKIFWMVAQNSNGNYVGGITATLISDGDGIYSASYDSEQLKYDPWLINVAESPFFGEVSSEIYESAITYGNLNSYFSKFNSESEDKKSEFITHLHGSGCYKINFGGQ